MHTLSDYNNSGIFIVTPESDLPADQQALNANFKTLATASTAYVPYTGATEDVDLGSHALSCASEAIQLDSDGSARFAGGGFTCNSGGSLDALTIALHYTAGATTIVTVDSVSGGLAHSLSNDGSARFAGGVINVDSSGNLFAASGQIIIHASGPADPYHTISLGADGSAAFTAFSEPGSAVYSIQINPGNGESSNGVLQAQIISTAEIPWSLDGDGSASFAGGLATIDSGGNLSVASLGTPGQIVCNGFFVNDSLGNTLGSINGSNGAFFSDNGNINSDGSGNMTAASLTSHNIILNNTTAPGSPVAGQIYFDGTHFLGWNGSAWKQLDN